MCSILPVNSASTLSYEYQSTISLAPKPIPTLIYRDSLQSWLLDLFPELNCQIHTKMLACSYLDSYMLERQDMDLEFFKLVAVLCLYIALKFEERTIITYEQIDEFFESKFNIELIQLLEINNCHSSFTNSTAY